MTRLIVDGYNVLGADESYRSLLDRDPDAARASLVEDVATLAVEAYQATVVFDGRGDLRGDGRPHHVAGVVVVFAGAEQDADSVIESLAFRARERGERAVVATSDAATQRVVMRHGVMRMSSRELVDEMRQARAEWRESAADGASTRTRLEELIDPRTREVLFRWARGR